MLTRQQRFKSASTKELKIDLTSNDDERMRSIDSMETYAYGTSKDLASEK